MTVKYFVLRNVANNSYVTTDAAFASESVDLLTNIFSSNMTRVALFDTYHSADKHKSLLMLTSGSILISNTLSDIINIEAITIEKMKKFLKLERMQKIKT